MARPVGSSKPADVDKAEIARQRMEWDLSHPEGNDEEFRWWLVEKSVFEQAVSGKVPAQELYARIKGKYVEKSETRILTIDADTLRRIERDAQRELGLLVDREGEVQGKPALLPLKLREDTEQGHDESSEVGTVALPGTNPDGV